MVGVVACECNSADLHSGVAHHTIVHDFVQLALWLLNVLVTFGSVSVSTLARQGAIKIVEDAAEWVLILDPSSHIGELESRGFVGSRTRVGRSGVEAVRAFTKGGCLVEVVVVEASSVNSEIFRPWPNYTVRGRSISLSIRVGRLSNDDGIDNLGIAVNDVFR